MFIYIIVFLLSSLFYRLSQNSRLWIVKYLFLIIAVLIPSLLAAYRDESVGRDYLGAYGNYVWDTVCGVDNFFDIPSATTQGLGFLYFLFNFVVSRVSTDVHFFFFCHEFFIIIFVIFVCEKLKKDYNSWILYALFLLYLYNDSFNMLRQIMAVPLGLYSTFLLIKHKIIGSYIVIGVAFFFHPSALLLLTQYPLLLLSDKFRDRQFLLFIFTCLVGIILVVGAQSIVQSFISYDLFDSRYESYLNQSDFKSNKFDLLYLFFMFVLVSLMTSKQRRADSISAYSITFVLVGFIITLLGSVTEIASRLAFYYILPSYFLLPMATNNKKERRIILLALLFFLTIRFVYIASGGNWSDTIPYKSKILNVK